MRDSRTWIPRAVVIALLSLPFGASASHGSECRFFVRAGSVASGPDGRSPARAFPTISAGVGALRNAGDVLCVGPGVYTEANIVLTKDGAPGFPIEVRGDASGLSTGDPPAPVRLVPPSAPQASTGFLLQGRRDIVIEGFDIEGFSDAGIQVRSSQNGGVLSSSVTLRNNRVTRCGSGIDVSAESFVAVEGNTTVDNDGSGISIQGCTAASEFNLCRGAIGEPVVPVVSNNRSGGNDAHGLFIRSAQGAVVQNNLLFSNGFAGITLRQAPDTLVVNNLSYANREHGIAVGSADLASPGALLINNTLYGNALWGVTIGSGEAASPGGTVVNNIIWRNGDGQMGIGVVNESSAAIRQPSVCNYVAGFNLMIDQYGPETPHSPYDRRGDPDFVDIDGADGVLGGEMVEGHFVDRSADDDFRLRQDDEVTSPAVDAGSAAVAAIGLTGSTASDGRDDLGTIDIGFHYGARLDQLIAFASPFMPLYVRANGDNGADGKSPGRALRSVGAAAQLANAGVTVVVGPGRYNECDIHPAPNRGKVALIADPNGERTGDLPRTVLVNAGRCDVDGTTPIAGETGFNIGGVCGVVVDGFHVTGALEDGIQVSTSDGAVVRNNVVFGNARRGINVVNSHDVRIVNNLAFGNNGGIQIDGVCRSGVDCSDAGSRRAVIEFNTAYRNGVNGFQIGAVGVSSHATLRYNVTGENGDQAGAGIEIGTDETRAAQLVGYSSAYNLVGDRYATGVPQGVGDLLLDLTVEPLYVDPRGIAADSDWLLDRSFRLVQVGAGQPQQTRAVDFSDLTAAAAGMDALTTRTDGAADSDLVDLGYHYPLGIGPGFADCDGNGRVTISELILAVGISLGNADPSACPAIDRNHNGVVSIDELIRAIGIILAT